MISSNFDQKGNTFKVVLDNGTEVSGTYKVIVVRSNSFCGLTFEVNCNRHEPPAEGTLEEKINFIAAKMEISKKLSEYSFNHVQFNMFPNSFEEHDSDEHK